MKELNRRDFLKNTTTLAAGAAVGIGALRRSTASWAGANDRVRVACVGIHGQGGGHIQGYTSLENVELAALCDVDESQLARRVKELEEKGKKENKEIPTPKLETDIRKLLEDKDIDAISIATPNHWHSLMVIWACQAGKHVYVEKPLSHNIWEGRKLVEAARKYNRCVQHGTQIRSTIVREAVQKLNEGIIGEVYMAKGLCYKRRGDIGKKPDEPVPPGVHYDLWIGPAPEKPFSQNRFHYNWHWQWDYGNGDIGNQGVHQMDVARWGLGVKLPTKVTAMGAHFMFDDDQETPNTMISSMWFPDAGQKGRMLVFEVRHWDTNNEADINVGGDNVVGNIFYGSKGFMVIDGYTKYRTYFGKEKQPGPAGEGSGNHFANFIDCIRSGDSTKLNAEAEEGHYSSALCHLANISVRLGRSLEFDPEKESFKGDDEANQMLTRQYRAPYVVPDKV